MKLPRTVAASLGFAGLVLGSSVATALEIEITSPRPEDLAFGRVELAAEVESTKPVKWVDFWVDGSRMGRVESEPWELAIDVGQANIAHHVRAVAEDFLGDRAVAEVTTRSIDVNEEMDVSLQQLFVSVTDGGRRVAGLGRGDFRVINDDGRRESIATFGGGDLPISSVLLVDSSESMRGDRLEAAIRGAEAFASLTRDEDETMMVFFSDRLLRVTPFASGKVDLGALLAGARAAGGTAVNDHLYYALNRLDPRLGRRVVVLLSDGMDVSSVLDMEEVLWRARRSQAMVYWIRLVEDGADEGIGEFSSCWRDFDDNRRQSERLEQIVRDSGGRVIAISRLDSLERAFREVMEELRQQYVIGFHPAEPTADGRWRRIKVRVNRSGVDVRAPRGYVD